MLIVIVSVLDTGDSWEQGSHSSGAQLGDRLNVYPVKGYSINVMLSDAQCQAAAPHVSLLDDETKLVTSRLGVDRFRVAGTAVFMASTTTSGPIAFTHW